MQNPNIVDTPESSTGRYFNNVYKNRSAISPAISSSIISWFQEQTGSRETATLLARTLINTAESIGEDPRKILQEFTKLPSGELNSYLALFLNSGRVPTSLLGIKNQPTPTDLVSRTLIF
jgi:hypothetical protein